MTKRRLLILLCIFLPLGAGIGYFNKQYQNKKLETKCPNGRTHQFKMWKSSGKLHNGKVVSYRECWHCGYIQSR